MFKRPQRHDVLSLNPIDKIVGVTFGATSAQSHFAERAGKFALALIQAQSPDAFPGLPRHGAEADALVGADFVLIVGIVNLVREGEDVAGAVAASPRVG